VATVTAPWDGRMQFSFADAAIANHSLGRMPLAGVEQVGPDRYVVAGSWPTPKPTPTFGFSSLTASQAAPETKPRTAAAALWPNLK
jgi:hypothetical protein